MTTKEPTQISVNEQQLRVFVSDILSRTAMMNKAGYSFGTTRDLYTALGYTRELNYSHYEARYRREGIAKRVIKAPVKATWRGHPEVLDGKDEKTATNDTAFCKEFVEFSKRVKLWNVLERLDTIAGIGQYGVLLLGVAAQQGFGTPLDQIGGIKNVAYLTPFSQFNAQINKYVDDPQNPRFGQPESYRITFRRGPKKGAIRNMISIVHWSRLIHIAEGLDEDEIFGTPRLEEVFNGLEDLERVRGAAAEGYWRSAITVTHGNVDKEADFDKDAVDKDGNTLADNMEAITHGFKKFLVTQGMSVSNLGPNLTSPKDFFDMLIAYIAGAKGIPQRILLGSERGELASTQDEANWNSRIAERRDEFAGPVVLGGLLDRLIEKGGITPPKSGQYIVRWPDLRPMTQIEKADLNLKRAQTAAAVAQAKQLGLFSWGEKEMIQELVGVDESELTDELSELEKEAAAADANR